MKRALIATVGAAALITWGISQPSVADGGGGGSRHRHVEIQDDCDPVTFNAALGEGACVGDGDTTFDELIDSLLAGDPDGHWRNHPDELHVRQGGQLAVRNTGGEFHTFTEVADFGAGCVPEINELLGLEGAPSADCGAAFTDPQTALPPGGSGTISTADMEVGVHKFMCMIHPWMQAEVEVRQHRHHH